MERHLKHSIVILALMVLGSSAAMAQDSTVVVSAPIDTVLVKADTLAPVIESVESVKEDIDTSFVGPVLPDSIRVKLSEEIIRVVADSVTTIVKEPEPVVEQVVEREVKPEVISAAEIEKVIPETKVEEIETPTLQYEEMLHRVDSLCRMGEDYKMNYCFAEAGACYQVACEICTDTLIKANLQKNVSSIEFSTKTIYTFSMLSVVNSRKFSVDDFFLYYPLEDKGWRPVQDAPAYYCPDQMDTLRLRKEEQNDIYPMICEDASGKKKYFASNELSGFGGYDLFVQNWNPARGDWDAPQNLGFPYSSPSDDFLYVDSPDGRYTFFASNRDCPADSVYIYVIEKGNFSQVTGNMTPSQLKEISLLKPNVDPGKIDNAGAASMPSEDNTLTNRYATVTKEIREIEKRLNGTISPEDYITLSLQLKEKRAYLEEIKQDFLRGAESLPEDTEKQADKVVVGAGSGYAFTRNQMGPELVIIYY